MGLDSSLFGYTNFKKLLDELDFFLNEYLPHQFISVFPPKLIHSTKWIKRIINKRMAFRNDNKYIPKYVPNDLKWYEKDGLDTWYFQISALIF